MIALIAKLFQKSELYEPYLQSNGERSLCAGDERERSRAGGRLRGDDQFLMRIPFLPDRVPELRRQPDVRSDIRAPLHTAQALRAAYLRRDRKAYRDC